MGSSHSPPTAQMVSSPDALHARLAPLLRKVSLWEQGVADTLHMEETNNSFPSARIERDRSHRPRPPPTVLRSRDMPRRRLRELLFHVRAMLAAHLGCPAALCAAYASHLFRTKSAQTPGMFGREFSEIGPSSDDIAEIWKARG